MNKITALFLCVLLLTAAAWGQTALGQTALSQTALGQAALGQAGSSCQPPADMATGTPPARADGAVKVSLGFYFADITGVSDVDQNLTADIIQVMEWADPRLIGLKGCFFPKTTVWTPRVSLINSAQLTPKFAQARDRVEILDGGRVRYIQRYYGAISTYHDLTYFPFDRQQFEIQIMSPLYDSETVQLVPLTKDIGIAARLNIEDWSFKSVSVDTHDVVFPMFDKPHSVMSIYLDANRGVLFYLYKIFVPLFLIVSMSWIVFWIPPSKFETQVGFGATSMLTLIAFQFGMSNNVPKLTYFTSMDYLVMGSTVLVFAAMVEALVTGVVYRNGHETLARRIERVSRIVFPLTFLTFWALILLRNW